ncbi:MAG: hypothetical protein O3A85_09615 [Proteobacteria bacterium]|nr:hypothetical protein [Pseudomonadota bacterium]
MSYDFLGESEPRTLIVYGLVTNPATVSGDMPPMPPDASFMLSNRFAVVLPSSPPLRLSSPGWIDISPVQAVDIQSSEDLNTMCRDRIMNRTSPFSKPVRSFLECYFRFIDSVLATDAPKEGLAAYRDWVFSAWLPMPHAQVLLPPDADDGPKFAEADVVFWAAGRLVVVMIEGTSMPLPSTRQRLAFLAERHPQAALVLIPQERIENSDLGFPIDLFPEKFSRICENVALPYGPYHPPVLMDKLDKQADAALAPIFAPPRPAPDRRPKEII